MQTFLYVEINVFALAVLLIIFLCIQNKHDKKSFDLKIFLGLIYLDALALIFDTAMWVIDGKLGELAMDTNKIVSAVYYIVGLPICAIWLLYVYYQVYKSKKILKKILLPILIPIIINAFFAILSMFGNYSFYIDENNVYHRGQLFIVWVVIAYIYLVYSLILIIVKRKNFSKKHFRCMLVFASIPLIAGIIQAFAYGVSLLWISVTISLLLIFINIQTDQLYMDHLTGICNRRSLDCYLYKFTNNNLKSLLGGIMIDLNSFKQINDIFGHYFGDQALEYVSEILKDSIDVDDFVARYGGDEFIILFETDDESKLIDTVNRIKENVDIFNGQNIVPYKLSLGMGYDTYDYRLGSSISDFIKHIDNLMYANKAEMKKYPKPICKMYDN